MEMERTLFTALRAWQRRDERMPLVLHGARQVGKTYILKKFGQTCFRNMVYVNLENSPRISSFFDEDISPARLVPLIEGDLGERIVPGRTLLVLDEIQSCPRALTSLKYFCEELPQLHVAGAGSLLGVAINRDHTSFPVGKVETMQLYPLDFAEFLWARGKKTLCDLIRGCYKGDEKMPAGLHSELMELYKIYLVTGGMPRVVESYIKSHSILRVNPLQNEIMNNYIADCTKYASPNESVKIRACYDSIPNQLAKENKKFQYKVVKSGGNAAYFGVAVDWLNYSGIVLKCNRVAHPLMPLAAHTEPGSFKLYSGDVGMLTMKSGIDQGMVLSPLEIDHIFFGVLAENYVAQALAALGRPLYYWQSDNTAEVDFVLQQGADIIPVEVKAGIHTKSRSIAVFKEKYHPPFAVRISGKNFGFDNGIKSVPLYAVWCLGDSITVKTN
jgi:predicted AAA+ superfamily ATPase